MTPTSRYNNRISKRIPIHFGTPTPTNLGFIKNLSLKGVAISSRVTYAPLTTIAVRIDHGEYAIPLDGRVRWAVDKKQLQSRMVSDAIVNFDMGIEFINRSDKYLDLLAELVSHFDENRRERRFEMILRVTFETPEEVYQEYTNNISLGGMFIATRNPPQLNTDVDVQLFLGDILELIQVRSRVVHVVSDEMAESTGMNPGIGIQFIKFHGDDETRFQKYIDELKSRFETI